MTRPDLKFLPEAAKFLRISESQLRKLKAEGHGPAFIMLGSRRYGFLTCDLLAWLRARRVPPRIDQ